MGVTLGEHLFQVSKPVVFGGLGRMTVPTWK
jgi:hypothetical protein